MSRELEQQILSHLPNISGVSDLRRLYCEYLNYEYADTGVPVHDWSESSKEVTMEAKIIARRGSFFIIYIKIKKLISTSERLVLNNILKVYPDCVVIFQALENNVSHIVSPRFDPEVPSKFLIRRYVIGPHERLRTASDRLSRTYAEEIDSSTRLKEKHDEAFNVEAVTKEFFETYKEVLGYLRSELVKQRKADEQTAHAFAQQLINRLMFLYFVQKKGWLSGDQHFIKNLLGKYHKNSRSANTFYSSWLHPLFFNAFNKKPLPNGLVLPGEILQQYARMPYLNGGLFLQEELDRIGFEIKDVHVDRVIDGLLERFNFTIREDTPLEVEVAVDPEMLGKVYESLVLEEERGKSGIFYTPRIEVDFMCRQSLVEHLVEKTKLAHDVIIPFVYAHNSDELPKLTKEDTEAIRDYLWAVKIADPACGSGAFLVGAMHVLVELHRKASQNLGIEPDDFELKKRIIQENLFGVDIKPWAIRVAELRLWLTLIVDADESKIDLYSNPLLPNLTFKLRVGDSLVQELAGKQLSVRAAYNRLSSAVREALSELIQLKRDYYYSKKDGKLAEEIKKKELEILSKIVKQRIEEIDNKIRALSTVQQKIDSADG